MPSAAPAVGFGAAAGIGRVARFAAGAAGACAFAAATCTPLRFAFAGAGREAIRVGCSTSTTGFGE
jgi:hypothetical protein